MGTAVEDKTDRDDERQPPRTTSEQTSEAHPLVASLLDNSLSGIARDYILNLPSVLYGVKNIPGFRRNERIDAPKAWLAT